MPVVGSDGTVYDAYLDYGNSSQDVEHLQGLAARRGPRPPSRPRSRWRPARSPTPAARLQPAPLLQREPQRRARWSSPGRLLNGDMEIYSTHSTNHGNTWSWPPPAYQQRPAGHGKRSSRRGPRPRPMVRGICVFNYCPSLAERHELRDVDRHLDTTTAPRGPSTRASARSVRTHSTPTASTRLFIWVITSDFP